MLLGAAQLGALAACVVLFVPMALAGYHLSRNKILFFGGSLFVSLALVVHLSPYFPSFPSSSPPPPPPPAAVASCLPYLHRIVFPSPAPSSSWSWAPSLPCPFHPLSRPETLILLNGSRVLFAGDSQSRLLALSLLRLLLPPSSQPQLESDLFRRHSDYHTTIPQHLIDVDFLWAPYPSNLTAIARDLSQSQSQSYPDVLVLGSGLWHMLHYADPAQYGDSLRELKRSVVALPPAVHSFWLGVPELVNSMLNTEEKRERMDEAAWEAYDREVAESGLLMGAAGGPMFLLDVASLSRGCGRGCTLDGMHYDAVVYEAALHVMLNALLIESQQRI